VGGVRFVLSRLNHKGEKMTAKKVVEMGGEEIIDEKKILKEAEEREKERKAEEEVEKAEAKAEEKAEKAEEKKVGKAKKATVRKKPRHGKKYRTIAEQIEKDKEYPVSEAIDLALKSSPAKFDATVEFHAKINVREKNIRGMVTLLGGVVKEKKVKEVNEANADEVIADIKAGKLDFDVMIADLKVMPKLAVLAKVLGPKGLMPSPKAGTAVADVAKAVEELKSGKVEYRADKYNVVHMSLGKISFGPEKVYQNYEAIIKALPIKKIDSIYITTTMGPSVKVVRK
jgi:large subunit ribosomal protein L1